MSIVNASVLRYASLLLRRCVKTRELLHIATLKCALSDCYTHALRESNSGDC